MRLLLTIASAVYVVSAAGIPYMPAPGIYAINQPASYVSNQAIMDRFLQCLEEAKFPPSDEDLNGEKDWFDWQSIFPQNVENCPTPNTFLTTYDALGQLVANGSNVIAVNYANALQFTVYAGETLIYYEKGAFENLKLNPVADLPRPSTTVDVATDQIESLTLETTTVEITATDSASADAVSTDAASTEAASSATTDAVSSEAVSTEASSATTDAVSTEAATTDAVSSEAVSTEAASATTDAVSTEAVTTDA
ncbi:hypothetical protein HDU79_011328, partial [Rhizoclosmatium sp. JEL0117]